MQELIVAFLVGAAASWTVVKVARWQRRTVCQDLESAKSEKDYLLRLGGSKEYLYRHGLQHLFFCAGCTLLGLCVMAISLLFTDAMLKTFFVVLAATLFFLGAMIAFSQFSAFSKLGYLDKALAHLSKKIERLERKLADL